MNCISWLLCICEKANIYCISVNHLKVCSRYLHKGNIIYKWLVNLYRCDISAGKIYTFNYIEPELVYIIIDMIVALNNNKQGLQINLTDELNILCLKVVASKFRSGHPIIFIFYLRIPTPEYFFFCLKIMYINIFAWIK